MTLTPFTGSSAIDEEAALWVARADGRALSADEQAELKAWLERSPQHRERFREMAALHKGLRQDVDRSTAPQTLSVSGATWLLAKRRPAAVSGLAATVAAVFALSIGALNPLTPTGPEVIRTAVGQQLEQQLADGSVVIVNTGTDLTFDLQDEERLGTMTGGEALFDVAHDPSRPFIVSVGARRVRVLGTTLSVRADEGAFEVLVEEGLVRVEAASTMAEDVAPILLSPKQRVRIIDEDLAIDALNDAELAREWSWRGGSLVFSETPLEEVVAEVSRYTERQIIIADATLRDVPIDGYFPVGDVDALIEALSLGFDIQASSAPNGQLELRSDANSN